MVFFLEALPGKTPFALMGGITAVGFKFPGDAGWIVVIGRGN
jgi:hypothetical protein